MLVLFLMHQMAIGLFRTIGALGRTMVIANTFGSFALLVVFLLGGFIISKSKCQNLRIANSLLLHFLALPDNSARKCD